MFHTPIRARAGATSRRQRHRPRCTGEALEARRLLSISVGPVWTEQGPGPILNGDVQVPAQSNPNTGAVNKVVLDASDPNTAYAATVNGGIWVTHDVNSTSSSGPSWTPLTDLYPSLSVTSLATSPLDSGTLYAGLGRTSSSAQDGGPEVGILKSTDHGATWQQENAGGIFNGRRIDSVVPADLSGPNGQIVLAGTAEGDGGGVYRSDDGGQTWSRISAPYGQPVGSSGLPSAAVSDLIADPGDSQRFYCALVKQQGSALTAPGIFRSDDGGLHWQAVNSNVTASLLAGARRIRLGIYLSPFIIPLIGLPRTEIVFASVEDYQKDASGNPLHAVFRSADGGTSWASMGAPPYVLDSHGNLTTFDNLETLAADPGQADTVFVGGDDVNTVGPVYQGVYSPSSGMTTWTKVWGDGANTTDPHADGRSLQFLGGSLVRTDDGGIYQLDNPTLSSRTWSCLNGNLRDTEFYSVAYDSLSHEVIGGAQDIGTSEQTATGSFTWRTTLGGDGAVVQVDNTRATQSYRYFAYYFMGGFFRRSYDASGNPGATENLALTVDGTNGQSLPQVETNADGSTRMLFTNPYLIDAANPEQMIIGSQDGLFESFDHGQHVTTLGGLNLVSGRYVPAHPLGNTTALAYGGFHFVNLGPPFGRILVADPDTLYVGAGGALWVRTSGAGLPTRSTTYPGHLGPRSIVLDPVNDAHAYVLDFDHHIYETTDAGATVGNWHDITGNLGQLTTDPRVLALYASRSTPTRVLLVGGGFAYASESQNLPAGGVFRAIDPSPSNGGPMWTQFGNGLADAPVTDLRYDPTDDVLLAGTKGRGAWTLSNASASLAQPSVMTITPDFLSLINHVRLVRDPNVSYVIDVYLNNATSTPSYRAQARALQQIVINPIGFTSVQIDSALSVPVTINSGANSLAVSDIYNEQTAFTLTANTLTSSAGAPISFSSVGQIILNGGSRGTTFSVTAVPAGTSVHITGGAGNDTLAVDYHGAVDSPIQLDGGGGNNSLQLTGAGTADSFTLTAGSVQHAAGAIGYSNVQFFTLLSGTFALNVDPGVLALTAGAGSVVNLNVALHLLALAIDAGRVNVAGASNVLTAGGVAISNGGTLDLTRNSLDVPYGPGPDPAALIRSYLAGGFNGAMPVPPGIVTSVADATHTLGLADSADGVVAGVPANTILVTYALIGDVNLDGKVGFPDLVVLARNYHRTNANWDQGDFNYDGIVEFGDLVTLARNYGHSSTGALAALNPLIQAISDTSTLRVPQKVRRRIILA